MAKSAFGYDEMNKQTFYGLQAWLRECWPRVIRSLSLSPADIHDSHMAEELLEDTEGWALGDRTYQSPKLSEHLSGEAIRPAYTMMIEGTPA